jgi:hypothetical protein
MQYRILVEENPRCNSFSAGFGRAREEKPSARRPIVIPQDIEECLLVAEARCPSQNSWSLGGDDWLFDSVARPITPLNEPDTLVANPLRT